MIDALMPVTRRELLRAAYGQPERWWYLSELATQIGTTPSSLQRELESLGRAGLLERRVDGRRTYYRAHPGNAIFEELRSIVRKTMGPAEEIRAALVPFRRKIEIAFLYGSVARGEDRATSDIDLFVIGTVGLSALAPVVSRLEKKLGREVNVTTMTRAEAGRRIRAREHFLTDVLRRPKEWLIGSEAELEELR